MTHNLLPQYYQFHLKDQNPCFFFVKRQNGFHGIKNNYEFCSVKCLTVFVLAESLLGILFYIFFNHQTD